MMDRGVRKQIEKNGPDYLFSGVKNQLQQADLVITNFECTAAGDTLVASDKKFTFRTNPVWLSALRNNGITHANLANNHSMDFGREGFRQTLANLYANNISPTGHNISSPYAPYLITANKNQLAIFSICTLQPEEHTGLHAQNTDTLAASITLFKQQHPRHLILVSLHWGVGMQQQQTAEQVKQAHALADAGADVIIGHHPHVVQPMEKYKSTYICYSLGNFIFDNNQPPANKEIMIKLSIASNKITAINVIPLLSDQCRPVPMAEKAAAIFFNEMQSLSPTLSFSENGSSWQIQ